MITIEKHIPPPIRISLKELPFSRLKVGDSFVVPAARNTVTQAILRWQRKTKSSWKFSTKTLAVDKARVWRVK